ncbi:hypothetical protein PENSPDRAFT_654636, partial [Peniophora sp. CONT]
MSDPWSELALLRIFTRPPGATRDDNRRRLDQEIQSLETILLKARELRNLENPFVTLPEELILRIILLAQGTSQNDITPIQNDLNRPRARLRTCARCDSRNLWASIFSTCRRFHSLSLSTVLYCDISDRQVPPALYERALVRSDSAPLSLTFHYDRPWMERSMTAARRYVKRNRARIMSLELHHLLAGSRFAEQFLPRLSLFTNLKHLSLIKYVSNEPFIISIGFDHRHILNWTSPESLESLYIDKIPFRWNDPIYGNLTELTLVNISARQQLNVRTLVDMFARMKRIRTLAFDHVVFDIMPEGPGEDIQGMRALQYAREVIRLPPSLRKLSVTAIQGNDNLFRVLSPSTSAAYSFKCLAPPDPKHFGPLVLGGHFYTPPEDNTVERLPPLASIAIVVEDGPTALQARASYSRTAAVDSIADVTLEYNIADDHTMLDFMRIIYDRYPGDGTLLLTTLRSESVHELSLDCACEYGIGDLTVFFGLIPNLRTLHITEDMLPSILPCLAQVGPGNEDHNDTNVVRSANPLCAPMLQTLHVKPSHEYGFVSSESTVHKLVNARALRRASQNGADLELRLPSVLKVQMDRFIEQCL